MYQRPALVLAFLWALYLSGCGLDSPDTSETPSGTGNGFVPVTGITGVPKLVYLNTPLTLSAVVVPENAANRTISWTVQNPFKTRAFISGNTLTVTESGSVTVTASVAGGAALNEDFSADFVITAPEPVVTGVTVSAAGTAAAGTAARGGTLTLSAYVEGDYMPPQSVTWSIAETPLSTGTAIDEAGVLSVGKDEVITSLTVKAVSVFDASKYGTAQVSVEGEAAVDSVTVTPQAVSLSPGYAHKFQALVTGTLDPSQSVLWFVSETTRSAISADGVLTVGSGETRPSLTVRAISLLDITKSAEAQVTITTGSAAQYREMAEIDAQIIEGSDSWAGTYSEGVFTTGRTVYLPAYKIAKYETTYALWYEVRQWAQSHGYTFANPGREGSSGEDGAAPQEAASFEPVTLVNWRDVMVWCNAYSEMCCKTPVYYADSFCTKAQKTSTNDTASTSADIVYLKSGANGYRLPTEAEWEAAARGGDAGDSENWNYKYAGSDDIDSVGWCNSESGSHAVGLKAPNGAGLFDCSGNVWEWCYDWYGVISGEESVIDPSGAPYSDRRVLRGGEWFMDAAFAEVSCRAGYDPAGTSTDFGFRVACDM